MQGIQSESRRVLGNAPGPLGDDDEIDDDEDREHRQADDDVAAHQERAERFDDRARAMRAFVAMSENKSCRGDVKPKPQHRDDEEDRRKRSEEHTSELQSFMRKSYACLGLEKKTKIKL